MENQPISSRLPEPRVQGAGESSGRDQRSSKEERREAFRRAREKAAAAPDASVELEEPTPARRRKPAESSDAAAETVPATDETDARGRKLDIRV